MFSGWISSFFFFWMQEPTLGLNLDGVDGDK